MGRQNILTQWDKGISKRSRGCRGAPELLVEVRNGDHEKARSELELAGKGDGREGKERRRVQEEGRTCAWERGKRELGLVGGTGKSLAGA